MTEEYMHENAKRPREDPSRQSNTELCEIKDILRTMQKQLASIPDIASTLAAQLGRIDSLEKLLLAIENKQPAATRSCSHSHQRPNQSGYWSS
eukprot:6461458-Amphidinium_carterae.2